MDAYSLINGTQDLQMITRISHDTCKQASTCPFVVKFSAIMQSSQSVSVNIGALLNQINQACGNQPPQIAIGGPQAVLANSGDKIAASGAAATHTTLTLSTNVSVVTPRLNKLTSDPEYSYKVKIINPNRKSDVAVFYLNDFSATFESVTSLRVKLIETFKEQDPNTLDFNV